MDSKEITIRDLKGIMYIQEGAEIKKYKVKDEIINNLAKFCKLSKLKINEPASLQRNRPIGS